MRLPAILRRAFAPKAATETLPAAPSRDVAKPEQSEWVDATAITRIVADCQSDQTKWVFASDMKELTDRIAAWNARAPQTHQLSLRLHKKVNDSLHQAMDEGKHAPMEPGENSNDAILRHVGPSDVGGLRICAGPAHIDCNYVYNMIESYLATGGRKIHFGMDGEFSDGFAQLSQPRSLPVPTRRLDGPA